MMQPFEELERKFGEWIGNPNCVAVSSGTTALHIALEALELAPGTFVAVPELAMVACPRAVALTGLIPRFVACDDKLLIDPTKIPSDCSVVMPVHLYGRQVDLKRVGFLGRVVVEDLAEAHGVLPHPHSAAACWSFYKNKIVHGEEGGMIAFANPAHAMVAKELRSLGFSPQHDFMHRPRGINGRMSNLHAEPILKSLEKVQYNISLRFQISQMYTKYLGGRWLMPPRNVDWVYDLRIPGMSSVQQGWVVTYCRRHGVEARHCFKPMSIQPEWNVGYGSSKDLMASSEVIYLPITEYMVEHDVKRNVRVFLEALKVAKIL